MTVFIYTSTIVQLKNSNPIEGEANEKVREKDSFQHANKALAIRNSLFIV